MSSEVAVACTGLGKAYRVYGRPHHRLTELLGLRSPDRTPARWALRGVDMTVRRGECVGVVGPNGAGKSTLLQLIAGTVRATEGSVSSTGRVAALLELTSGFNPELTGRENVGLRAAVLGLSARDVRERFDAIAGFAGIGAHMEEPVRTYSTGMQARLAFAVAAHVDADVLIVDETLAVGDGMFVQKCMRWIRRFRERGTLLFVSHATNLVTDLCDRAVWLDGGTVVMDGDAKDVVREYASATHRGATGVAGVRTGRGLAGAGDAVSVEVTPDADFAPDARRDRIVAAGLTPVMEGMRFDAGAAWWGKDGARVESVRLLDEQGRAKGAVETGARVVVEIACVADERLERPVAGYVVRNRNGLVLFSDNSWLAFGQDGPGAIPAGRRFVVRFRVQFPHLPAGEFALGAAVADGGRGDFVQHHRVDDALLFRVARSHLVEGVVGAPMLGCEFEDAGEAPTTSAPRRGEVSA